VEQAEQVQAEARGRHEEELGAKGRFQYVFQTLPLIGCMCDTGMRCVGRVQMVARADQ